MGLDMYLERRKYIGANLGFNKIEGTIDVEVRGKKIPVDFEKVKYISEEVGYWRKANAIHQWFVTNVQNGEDNCKEYYVELEQLESLLKVCKRVKKYFGELVEKTITEYGKDYKIKVLKDTSVAQMYLPTQEGFFFGGTEYDEYYMKSVEETIKIIKQILKEEKAMNKQGIFNDYYYSSSW